MMVQVDFDSLGGGGFSTYTPMYRQDSGTTTHTMDTTNYKGKKLLGLLYTWSSSALSYDLCDNATLTGGTITKIDNLTHSNNKAVGTFYLIEPSANSCVLTTSSGGTQALVVFSPD